MSDQLKPEEVTAITFSPVANSNVISLVKQEDGNWRGFMQKNGQLIQVRQSDPNTVLNMLLTHE
jgi:hypothetical protein